MADDKTGTESTTPKPASSVRGDAAPTPDLDREEAGPTKEQLADAKTADKIVASHSKAASQDDDKATTDHIPAYGQTHASRGVPFQENPLNPGFNPTILPGPSPDKA